MSWWRELAAGGAMVAMAGCAGMPASRSAASPTPARAAAPAPDAHSEAVQRATEFCRKKGMAMRVVPAPPPRPGQLAAEMQFRCVKAG